MTTERIAKFVAETGYGEISSEAIGNAEKCILDTLGVIFAGNADRSSRILVSYVRQTGGRPEATVIGAGFRTDAADAALANGTMAHALDFDDYSLTFQHATAITLPATLALAEREGRSGRDVLEAYILGYEVGAKVGTDLSDPLLELGWHACSVVGSLAASVCGAKIMRLSQAEIRRAMGIAASAAGGLRKNFGTDTKPFHAGNAAKNGVIASLLAKQGFTANESILEEPLSLPRVMLGKEHELQHIKELGTPFDLVLPGPAIKPYPSCGTTHRSVTAMLELVIQKSIKAEEVSEVECSVPRFVREMLAYDCPQTGTQAKFSMQYCMAAAILDGEVGLKQFTDEKVLDAKAQALMRKVRYGAEVKVAASVPPISLPQIVRVKLHDGSEYCHQVAFAKGDPRNPMSWEEVVSKFKECTRSFLAESDMLRVIELVSNLGTLDNIAELTEVLATRT